MLSRCGRQASRVLPLVGSFRTAPIASLASIRPGFHLSSPRVPVHARNVSSSSRDSQQNVRIPNGFVLGDCASIELTSSRDVYSCSPHLSKSSTPPSMRSSKRCARILEQVMEYNTKTYTGKKTSKALYQPHSLRELHFPSCSRCAGECHAKSVLSCVTSFPR